MHASFLSLSAMFGTVKKIRNASRCRVWGIGLFALLYEGNPDISSTSLYLQTWLSIDSWYETIPPLHVVQAPLYLFISCSMRFQRCWESVFLERYLEWWNWCMIRAHSLEWLNSNICYTAIVTEQYQNKTPEQNPRDSMSTPYIFLVKEILTPV